MRNVLIMLGLVLVAAGCEDGPGAATEPPVLTVTSPARGLVRDQAGQVVVAGTATPNRHGDQVAKVVVNHVKAALTGDGAFAVTINVPDGATLIETVATDVNGAAASDTRAVHTGQRRAVGGSITSAISAAVSAEAFARISAAAGPLIKAADMPALLAPLQPIVHVNDPTDCVFARLDIENVKFADIKISLSPVQGGLAFRAELDGLQVLGHARWSLTCGSSLTALQATADQIVVAGTLAVTPHGSAGFTTRLTNPEVAISNPHVSVGELPDQVLGWLHLDDILEVVVPRVAEVAMNPLVNLALGAVGGPQHLDVAGTKLDLQVAPSLVVFDPSGAMVSMDVTALLAGGGTSPGYLYTDHGAPSLDFAHGFHIAVAADLANELTAEAVASGLLELAVPVAGGTFDGAQVHLLLPPVIAADAVDGTMHLVIGDLIATFTNHGAPVGKAAINATADLKIVPARDGYGIALQLGPPQIHVDPLDDIANLTGLKDDDLANAAKVVLGAQIDSIGQLLATFPLPSVTGLKMRDLSIGADDGYVMVNGRFD